MTDLKLIDVRFDGNAWWIEDDALDKALQFSRLADAVARASELSTATGREVRVHGWEGDLIDTFLAASDGYVPEFEIDEDQAPEVLVLELDEPLGYGYSHDASARFSLLELY